MFNQFMAIALKQAQIALDMGEVPVGAVIVKDGAVVSAAFNMCETNKNATAHAEILAISEACEMLENWRLYGCDMYVTLEPCAMCAGALINARIQNVYFGAYDKENGAFGTVINSTKLSAIHKPTVYGGIMENACNEILNTFFTVLRK